MWNDNSFANAFIFLQNWQQISKKDNSDLVAVAKAARVSASTASRGVNHPKLVKLSTCKKIDKAARKLGYIRNRAAQTIHGILSGTVGLDVPNVDQAIFEDLIQSISESLEELGFTVLLASHAYNHGREYSLVRTMLERRAGGIALAGMEHSADTCDLLIQQNTPALLL